MDCPENFKYFKKNKNLKKNPLEERDHFSFQIDRINKLADKRRKDYEKEQNKKFNQYIVEQETLDFTRFFHDPTKVTPKVGSNKNIKNIQTKDNFYKKRESCNYNKHIYDKKIEQQKLEEMQRKNDKNKLCKQSFYTSKINKNPVMTADMFYSSSNKQYNLNSESLSKIEEKDKIIHYLSELKEKEELERLALLDKYHKEKNNLLELNDYHNQNPRIENGMNDNDNNNDLNYNENNYHFYNGNNNNCNPKNGIINDNCNVPCYANYLDENGYHNSNCYEKNKNNCIENNNNSNMKNQVNYSNVAINYPTANFSKMGYQSSTQ